MFAVTIKTPPGKLKSFSRREILRGNWLEGYFGLPKIKQGLERDFSCCLPGPLLYNLADNFN
jgi:hypothetical protein